METTVEEHLAGTLRVGRFAPERNEPELAVEATVSIDRWGAALLLEAGFGQVADHRRPLSERLLLPIELTLELSATFAGPLPCES